MLIPVPAADPVVARFRRRLDPALGLGMPAHVTVLYPFSSPASMSDSSVERLGTLFGGCQPFDFALSDIAWFDDRVMYLAPAPREAFVDLTARIAEEFPDYPPYKGQFADVIPHLTVGEDARPSRMRRAARRLEPKLPIKARATEVRLMAPDSSGHWGVLRTFALGRELP